MPTLSDDEVALAWVRSEIGSGEPPTDDELDEIFDLLQDKVLVAIDVLKHRRAAFVRASARITVPGQVALDNSANITALDRQLKLLGALAPAIGDQGPGFGTALLKRPSHRSPALGRRYPDRLM